MLLEKLHLISRFDSISARFFINILDKADPRCLQQALSVAEVSHALGKALKLEQHSPEEFWLTGLLHDIGILGIEKEITNKKGKLTKNERRYIEQHPKIGRFMVDKLFNSSEISQAVLHHHEHFDGTGYPKQLSGDGIPIMARVIAVADCYDAMRNAHWLFIKKSHEEAVSELKKCAGTQFDPEIVKLFNLNHDPIYIAYEKASSVSVKEVLSRI